MFVCEYLSTTLFKAVAHSRLRYVGRVIMYTGYAIDVQEEGDPWLERAEFTAEGSNSAFNAGAWAVDIIPAREPKRTIRDVIPFDHCPQYGTCQYGSQVQNFTGLRRSTVLQ